MENTTFESQYPWRGGQGGASGWKFILYVSLNFLQVYDYFKNYKKPRRHRSSWRSSPRVSQLPGAKQSKEGCRKDLKEPRKAIILSFNGLRRSICHCGLYVISTPIISHGFVISICSLAPSHIVSYVLSHIYVFLWDDYDVSQPSQIP